jgi:hypothetical protein
MSLIILVEKFKFDNWSEGLETALFQDVFSIQITSQDTFMSKS